jgi:TatA/E family protein of Tat protein translocase
MVIRSRRRRELRREWTIDREEALMAEFGPWHLLIVAGVFMVLFGAKKLPEAARSLGKSARILKTELKGLHDDDVPPG